MLRIHRMVVQIFYHGFTDWFYISGNICSQTVAVLIVKEFWSPHKVTQGGLPDFGLVTCSFVCSLVFPPPSIYYFHSSLFPCRCLSALSLASVSLFEWRDCWHRSSLCLLFTWDGETSSHLPAKVSVDPSSASSAQMLMHMKSAWRRYTL